jgi:two-component SAPR family response regulator
MQILAVDDERLALEGLISAIRASAPDAEIQGFRNGEEALKFATDHDVQVAFLDIEMRGLSGLELAKQLSALQPRINIIFTTGYSNYSSDAFALHASGYIHKPVTERKIREELSVLRYSVGHETKRLRVQCFGNFDVMFDGKPLRFQYNKSRECLAYLVSRRGAMCSMGEMAAVLWPDDDADHVSYLKNIRVDLGNTFSKLGLDDVLARQRGLLGIVPSQVNCDYYLYLENPDQYRHLYNGEFMAQYSWAEPIHGMLEANE